MHNYSILFIINYLDVGGAGKILKHVANLCTSFFGRVVVITTDELERSTGLNDAIKHMSLGYNPEKGILWRLMQSRKLRNVIKEFSPDIICPFVSDVCFVSRIASYGLKPSFVSAERGDPYTKNRIWKLLMRWTYNHSDFCFFQLPQARDYYGSRVKDKSFVIPNVFIQEKGITPYFGIRKKTIVSAGRFVPEKRYEVLIEAFAKVHQKHPEYRLTLYGEGVSLEKYKQLANSLGVSDLIEYPGYVNGVARTIREDGIFVLSSMYEGIPNSLIEALSVGIPCISTDCTPGGPRFLTKDGRNGLLVPVNDVDAMTHAILSVIEDSDLSDSLSEKGPEIIDELKPEVIDRQWFNAFKTIIFND